MTDESMSYLEALKEIKRLKEALEQEPCDDCISRQAVLDIVNNPLNIRLADIIKALPSVTPKEKTGKWIDVFGGCECSECECLDGGYSDYCPNCGARMIESQ